MSHYRACWRARQGGATCREPRGPTTASAASGGEPGGNRTPNPQIKSLLLCQLSYRPAERFIVSHGSDLKTFQPAALRRFGVIEGSCALRTGNRTVNVAPLPSPSLSAAMVPP